MADIAWSAYALQMFTPEQRAAAVNATSTYVPEEPRVILPPPPPASTTPILSEWPDGLNPNIPAQLAEIHRRGWQFINGRWYPASALGVPATPESVANAPSAGRPPGMATVAGMAVIGGGSVLGTTVPQAPPVLLPSFVGGRVGVVRRSGGLRPESGGTPRVSRNVGPVYPWLRVVRT